MPTKKAAPKKTAKKKPAAKKVAVKKTTRKSTKKKPLVYASNQKSFWVTDGQVLNSVVALRDALDTMEKAAFTHHVTKEKNDFATWVDTVLGDKSLAKDLHKTKTPRSAKTAVTKHLKNYSI